MSKKVIPIPKATQDQLIQLVSQMETLSSVVNTICSTVLECNGINAKEEKFVLSEDKSQLVSVGE